MNPSDPRALRTREAIVEAAAQEIAQRGIAGLHMDGIARAAGVSRSTLYRHFDELGALLFAALDRIAPPAVITAGPPEQQIESLLVGLGRALRNGLWGAVVASVVEMSRHDPAVRRYHRRFTDQRRKPLVAQIKFAIERNELPRQTDPQQLATLLAAPIYYHLLVLHQPMTDAQVRAHFKTTWASVAR